jgi:hypothetical protein
MCLTRYKPSESGNRTAIKQTTSKGEKCKKKFIWKGSCDRQKRKLFVDSHARNTGFSISFVKGGQTRIVVNLKDCVNSVNVWLEIMLILNDL